MDSRAKGTRLLVDTLTNLSQPPKVLVSASAMGYYGDRGDEVLTEESSSGSMFLSEVCRQWEAATHPARDKGIRVVNTRNAVVLSPKAGALQRLLLPFKLGGGGRIGNGKQYWSWIDLDDMVGVIHHAIMTDDLEGPVNAGSPNPVTNEEFAKTLGRVLNRPAIFPLPAFVVRIMFRQMADEMLLASGRMQPGKLLDSGYQYRYPDFEGALRHQLGK